MNSYNILTKFLFSFIAAALIFAGCSSDDEAAPPPEPTTTVAPIAEPPPSTTEAPPTTTTSAPPTTVAPPSETESNNILDASAGIRHTCMLYERGDIWCWGENENGQLGDGEFGTNVYSTIPVKVRGINDAVAIAAGWEHTCAVHATGEVSCWGDDSHGELGNGETANFAALPVKVVGITDAVAVTAGHWHTCALRESGSIACWGGDYDGQLGNGDAGNMSAVPVDVTGISDAVAVSAGGEHTCAVHATGEISCWGDNWLGELGTGEAGNEFDSGVPVKVSGIDDAVAVSAGDLHTCALRESGAVSCWGDNSFAQLANTLNWPDEFSAVPMGVPGMTDAVSVSSGGSHACALREGGSISCWGGNISGQLGTAPADTLFSINLVTVEGIDDATALTAGAVHTCAVRESGGVFCWGSNYHGQLGHGQHGGVSYEKVRVAGIDDAAEVSAASRHTCVAHDTGEVSCWGTDWRGEAPGATGDDYSILPVKVDGISTATGISAESGITCATLESDEVSCWGFFWTSEQVTTDTGDISPVPVKWPDLSDITRIETGGSHACALHEDGAISCGGANWYGNLGNGEFGTSISWIPEKVVGIDDAVDISLGFAHTCAVHETGEVSCWGRNEDGQLGNGTDGLENNSPTPVKVQGITDAVGIASGDLSLNCVLHETGEVSCWGTNYFGELGTAEEAGGLHSSLDHVSVPVKIEGITDAAAVTAGNNHICVLHETSEVSCWGSNTFGQLGTDDHIADDRTATPQKVSGITGVTGIDAGRLHTCVVTDDGSVTCWGWDDGGQLGDGRATANTDSYTPVAVFGTITPPASDTPVDVAAGIRHTCMLYERGDIWCWGENENGQLGDGEFGTNVYSTIPVKVQDINDAVAIAAGWEHTCAVHATGEVSCWGDDSHGELGNGEESDFQPLPVKVVDITDAVAVSAGHWHTCALRESGSIACWGGDHDGQLGNGELGDEFDSAVPVEVADISDAVAISAGGEHTCAVHATGEISCWGDNWLGELGTGEAGNEFDSGIPVKVSGIDDATSVSAGDLHTCAVRESGNISCWGDNAFGQLGRFLDWPNEFSAVPVSVPGVTDAVSVSSGGSHTCAMREGGSILCWGSNVSGQISTEPADTLFSIDLITVEGIDDATALTAGTGHTCAVRESGGVFCWGSNYHGQLGHGQNSGVSYEKVRVAGIGDAAEVSAAARHTCITHDTGEVSCWGTDWRGEPPGATGEGYSILPVKIDGISTAIGISSEVGITCATLRSNEASCWGFYLGTELTANDDGNTSPAPIKWGDASDIARIETGGNHACALHNDGTISCAGTNWYGSLGNGEFGTSVSWTPGKVVGIDDAVDVSLGFGHTCAAHATGEVSCWGRNDDGQLGNGTDGPENNSSTPVKVQGIDDAVSVASGELSLSCVLHETGEVSCWGTNYFRELGTAEEAGGMRADIDHVSVPVKIEGITDATAVTAGNNHICVLHETGEVSCWGSNTYGQLGTDDHIADDQTATPQKVSGITDAADIDAGGLHTCTVSNDGSVTCWGWDQQGQLGDGRATANTDSHIPVSVFGTITPPASDSAQPVSDSPVDVAAGIRHTCMLYRGGSVSCWGENENGQLGDGEFGTNVYSTVPVDVQDIDDAVAIATGWEHTCAVHATGEVSCWGDDTHGELGNGETADFAALPVKVVGITDATTVTAGHWHTCALRESGSIACWGGDHDGQLGDGPIGDAGNMSAVPVEVLGVSDAVAVSAGGEHTCALHENGEVSCWGDNWRGELGTGEAGNEFDSGIPVKVSGIDDAIAVSSGDLHTCAVHESGNISCWGDNAFAQLGNPLDWQNEFSAVPLSISGMTDVVSVSSGSNHTCAVSEDGSVSCWGANVSGQLGVAPAGTFFSASPVTVEGIDDAIALTAGAGHSCAVRESGGSFCWGSNYHGQLGHGQDGGVSYEKVRVAGIDDAAEVSTATRHTCITHETGEVSCWGTYWRGEAPSGADDDYSTLPVKVAGIETAIGISANPSITCATLESNEASCWGFYLGTELTTTDSGDVSPVPIKWGDASDIARIETGGSHACALHSDGTISCAGANWYGNLGNGEFGTSISWAPAKVVGIDDAVDISLGFAHTCAVHATGEASCWGRNDDGQLGDGTDGLENNSPTPVKVQGITDAISIASGELSLSCVLHETGEVSCWGSNNFGELGAQAGGIHSAVDHLSVPAKIEGITDATAVTAGNSHICVLHETGEVSCWGSNAFGELGTDDHIADDQTSTPQKVTGITDITYISAGTVHTCVVSDEGSVTCWGWDQEGQLGDGHAADNTDSYTPVRVSGT